MPPASSEETSASYLVIYVEPSSGTNPGHMTIGQEDGDEARYFGFRFDPFVLPPELREPKYWRDYLFDNAVPGRISDEVRYVQKLLAEQARDYRKRRQPWTGNLESHLPPKSNWDPHAFYSFNPDSDFPDKQPCYNCVKWAVEVANRVIEGFVSPVPQGRVKLIYEQLGEESQ